jgi:Rhodopirellula transposase DDE domain
MVDPTPIRDRYAALSPQLDERGRRHFAASEARAAGHGGIAATARATGIARSTIGRGLKDLADRSDLPAGRVRRPGGGRKPLTEVDAMLLDDLLGLVSPSERGDPMSPLRWTCKSLRRLAAELGDLGHQISHTVVGELLKREGFSLQANRKTREGEGHPDRDAQFAHIQARVTQAMAEKQPVISVDTKKKELVGISRMPAGRGAQAAIPRTCACMTS